MEYHSLYRGESLERDGLYGHGRPDLLHFEKSGEGRFYQVDDHNRELHIPHYVHLVRMVERGTLHYPFNLDHPISRRSVEVLNKIKVLLAVCIAFFLITSFMSFQNHVLLPIVKADESRLYWYNGLDNLSSSEIYWSGHVTPSTNWTQGVGAVNMTSPSGTNVFQVSNSTVSIPFVATPPVDNATTYGVYAYYTGDANACPTAFVNWVFSNANGSFVIGFRPHYFGGDYDIATVFSDPDTPYTYYDTGIAVSDIANTWNWFEIQLERQYPYSFGYYIDGSFVDIEPYFVGHENITNITPALATQYESQVTSGYVLYDYARVYEGEEYPPWLIGTDFNIQVTSIPINATVIWEDTLQYDLPHNFSASAGLDHTITATTEVSISTNERAIFQGWSIDGSPTITTSNPLVFHPYGDMTLQAIYSLVEIPDPFRLWTNFGIGLIGLIMMGMSWIVAYWLHKSDETLKGILIWFAMFIIGYGLFTVMLGG